MSDWQVGDLAVCMDTTPRPSSPPGGFKTLAKGAVYRVRGMRITKSGGFNLLMEGHNPPAPGCPTGKGWRADRFRKIRPDEHEACETEFVTLLKRSKRPVSA